MRKENEHWVSTGFVPGSVLAPLSDWMLITPFKVGINIACHVDEKI